MKKIFYGGFIFLTAYNIYLSAQSVLHGEVNFFNDVARDFLLLDELSIKKIVLIGPRSSTNGLFHGPLLTYIDFPAYFLGGGNPLTVAWFWVLLGVILSITSFILVKKLFGVYPAFFYVLLLSSRMIPHISSVFEPEAMFFVMPIFLFTIIRYAQTKKALFLAEHLITVAVFIQLSIGIGIQFLVLSTLLVCFLIYKNKKWKHLLSFLLVPLFTSNYILFDVRHNFMMTHALLGTGSGSTFFVTVSSWIQNRIDNIISLELLDVPDPHRLLLLVIFVVTLVLTIYRIKKDKKQKSFYLIILFYYLGYMLMSYFNKGLLLFHYIYLLAPLTYLWLVSFLRGKTKMLFTILVVIIYMINLTAGKNFANSILSGTSANQNSWKELHKTALIVSKLQNGKEFGYFVFSPDSFAYQPRYAMLYTFKETKAAAYEYSKKETTYVIAAPPPKNDKYMDYRWWVRVPVGITASPIYKSLLPNGYTILKYHLTPAEQKVPHDTSIELGIHFR